VTDPSLVLSAPLHQHLPSLVARTGVTASKRFFEFFTVTIRNEHTRAAYLHAVRLFFDWCDARGLTLERIEPVHVAAYVEHHPGSKTTIKQHMSALRMLFSYFVGKGVLSYNPAREVKTEKVRRTVGKTPAFEGDEVARLLASFDTSHVVGLRDRALISVLAYTCARAEAVVRLKVRDYMQSGRRSFIRLHEKGGVENDVPCHHELEGHLDSYIEAAGIADDREGPLFRSAVRRTGQLTSSSLHRADLWAMIRRRLRDAGIEGRFGCHSFRATGATNLLDNGVSLDVVQAILGHRDSRTTKLYDRRALRAKLADIERMRYRNEAG
jgi:site-specific recombinase XerD